VPVSRTRAVVICHSSLVVCFAQVVAVCGRQVQAVDLLELLYGGNGRVVEGQLLLERVKHYAFEQVSEGEVEVLGEPFQHLQQPTLHPDTRLNSFDCYHDTMVHRSPDLACPVVSGTNHAATRQLFRQYPREAAGSMVGGGQGRQQVRLVV